MRKFVAWCVAAVAVTTGTQAQAAWYRASSRHFVIYAESNPDRLRNFAVRLEKYDQAVRAVMHYDDAPVGDGNRLTVFVLPSVSAVQKMAGDKYIAFVGCMYGEGKTCEGPPTSVEWMMAVRQERPDLVREIRIMGVMIGLDLTRDAGAVTAALVDVASVSEDEGHLDEDRTTRRRYLGDAWHLQACLCGRRRGKASR